MPHSNARRADRVDVLLAHRWSPTQSGADADPTLLRAVLAAADGRTLAELGAVLSGAVAGRQRARATLAWMLKYDLLRPTH